jgi:hypothetical protein
VFGANNADFVSAIDVLNFGVVILVSVNFASLLNKLLFSQLPHIASVFKSLMIKKKSGRPTSI